MTFDYKLANINNILRYINENIISSSQIKMFKFKKILIIFILSFFVFIPNVSAKYVFSIDVACDFQIDIQEQTDYMIYNLEDLINFRNLQNNKIVNFKNKNIYLMNDIDLSEYYTDEIQSWIPIGSKDNPFEGNFNGNSHTISNLKIETTSDCQGFFGQNNGDIRNFTISGNIIANNCQNIGGAVGINCGALNYIKNRVIISGTSTQVGGIAGTCIEGEIIRCKNFNNIAGNNYVGGICGYSKNSYLYRCGNENDLEITNIGNCTGGIVRIF